MENQVVNIKSMSIDQIKKAIGQDTGSENKNNIPRLSINRNPDDEQGNTLPVGSFMVYDPSLNENVYGKPVTVRPFISAMQYMHFEPEKGEYVNRSIIFKNWKEEALDILGGTKCGKLPYKDRDKLSPEVLAEQRKIRCYKLIYGLISFKGKLAKGTDHTIENLPIIWRVTGTSYNPVTEAIESISQRNKLMYACTLTVDTKRQKKGGNTFYTPDIKVNTEANLKLTEDDLATIQVFQESITKENNEVVALWKTAKDKKYTNGDASSAKLVEQLDAEESDPVEIFKS
jgi:hypothetical protein